MSKPSKKVISLALAAAMLLSACGNASAPEAPNTAPSTPSAPTEAPSVKSEPLKNLAISERAANELESLIIMHTQTTAVSDVLTNLYDGLLEVNNEGKIVECLAEEWGTEDGGKTWTFKLRQDASWVDYEGNVKANCTAHDFATGMEWTLNFYKNESYNTSMPIDMIEGAKEYYEYTKSLTEEEAYALTAGEGSKFAELVGLEVVDDHTLVYNLLDALPYFDTVATYSCLYPAPQALIDEIGANNYLGIEFNKNWYNGAYYLNNMVLNNEKDLVQNPNYWDKDCTRFETVTWKMVDSNENAYSLYQSNEIDYVVLTESAVKSILDNPDHEFHEYMAETLPNASVTMFNWAYWVKKEDGTPDYNWNTAIANRNFRKAIYHGVDLTDYYSRTNPVNPLKLEGNTDTCPGFVYLSDGTDYYDLVKEGLGFGDYNGETMVRLNKEEAEKYKAAAIEELTALGVTFPVVANYYVKGGDQTAMDTAVVLKNALTQSLGADFIDMEIKTYINSDEYRVPMLNSLGISGWNPDYGDPQNLHAQYLYGYDNAIFNVYGTRINEVVESPENKEAMDMWREYTRMCEEANAITDDLDARYKKFAEAEIYLLDNALIMPGQRSTKLCLSKVNIYSKPYALYGICNNKMKNWEARTEAYTAAELEELKQK